MIIDCAVYVAGVRTVEPGSLADAGRLARATEGFVWVALSDPAHDELESLGTAFRVQLPTVDRKSQSHKRPRLEHQGDMAILTMKTVGTERSDEPLSVGEVDIIIGRRHAIAIGHSSPAALEGASQRLRTRPEVASHGPTAAAWALLDAVIEGTESVVDRLGDELEMIQAVVFQGSQDQSEPIYLQLQKTARLARAMHPMLTIFDRLERGELLAAPDAMSPLLGDLSDQARRLSEEVMMLGEALDGLLNVNLARVTVRQNVIIQQVSAWAAIAAVATIITGIYGMNFRHMPELDWLLGYPMAIAIMILTVVVLRWYFKRAGWL